MNHPIPTPTCTNPQLYAIIQAGGDQQLINENALEPTTKAFSQLSPQSQETIAALVRSMEPDKINTFLI